MKNIVIKWAVFLTAFLISLEVSAQNVRVSGVVTDALGPIPGANIMEEGTTNGTVTDVNGKYLISVSAKSTLVFSCIGYKEQKIRVGTKTVLNVIWWKSRKCSMNWWLSVMEFSVRVM